MSQIETTQTTERMPAVRRPDTVRHPSQRPLNTAIVGGGKGCESFMRMVAEEKLGHFRMYIRGVADEIPDAPGLKFARALGVELVTSDYRELYDIPDLDLIIELTGDPEIRDEVERTRPRHVRFIDHFGAGLFWEVYTAQKEVIQQRTEMRAEVESERDRVSQIFNSIPDEIVVVDTNMRVQEINHSFLRNNNLSEENVVGKHCYDLPQAARGECQVTVDGCPFFDVIKTRRNASRVVKHLDDNGQARFAAMVAAPLFDPDGDIVGVIESTRDITKRLRLEEELKATEVQLQQFMEHAPLAVYIKNRHGQYMEVNPAACALFGRTKAEIVGRTDLEIHPRETAETLRTSDRLVLSTRSQASFDGPVVFNGRRLHLSTTKYPVLDLEGNVAAVCAITRDATALKEAELELTRTRDYLQQVLRNSPIIVVTTDLNGRIVEFNPGAEESLGYSRTEVIGQRADAFYKEPLERRSLVQRVRQEGSVRDYETVLMTRQNTELPVNLSLSQLKNDEGKMIGTVGISKDISHRKVLMDQVIQSERLAAVGRLAAGVAHEINNPLAVIGEISGFLQECLEDDPQARDPETMEELTEGLPRIVNQVDRCRSITHRLLSFARKSEVKVEVANIKAALDEVLPFLEKEASLAQVTIHREVPTDLPKVSIEEMQLEEIFINLINNAMQAIGKRGHGNIWLRGQLENGKVVVEVQDDGPGISKEVRSRLFDPFVTTKAPGHGTGLGLSICYGIVKRYDGAITVDSDVGDGATFRLILRVAD